MKRVLVVSMLAVLTGCAIAPPAPKTLTPSGGSKADGIVKMSYEREMFDVAEVNKDQALASATSRCTGWGYTGAEPFGGETSQCSNFSSSLKTCTRWTITVQYQCTGQAK